ncbi:PREDICTED: dolichol-phosphate mannosyltransferase subunit 3 isoform X2 [Ceratosolen solmsi marchali]|nr:PREDICTED: dolichol-phosphate mannosyltransferase subunit 3 isoform X2 [Ceratosolen solmsi marchali]
MTKLMEWILVGLLVLSSWIAVLIGKPNYANLNWYYKWFPVIFIFLFAVYAVITVLYRVFTFNNCKAAAIELQNQIKEARADLESKGISFKKQL